MLYEKHKEKLKFRIGVLIENPTEKEQAVNLFGMWHRHLKNKEVKLSDYYCNHLFDDGELTFINSYLRSSPIRVMLTVIKCEDTSQLVKPINICHISPNGASSTISITPCFDVDPYQYSPTQSIIRYSYVLDSHVSFELQVESFTSFLIEFIPEETQKDYYNSLGRESSIAYNEDKRKYLFLL